MPLSTGMDMNQGPVGADTSSSHNSSVSCHRQLECSTGMTEGVSDHATSPQLSQHNAAPTNMPTTSSNPRVRANQSVETNGGELLGGEDAAGAALSKATSHLLSPSLTPQPLSVVFPREAWPSSQWEGRRGLSRVCFVISMLQL